MPDHSASNAYELLLSAFREYGLDWVVDQIQEHVQAGKSIDKSVISQDVVRSEVLDLDGSAPERPPRTSRKRGLTTEPYSAEERLDIAIDALEAIAVQTTEIENHLADFLEKETGGPAIIRFEPDELDRSDASTVSRPSSSRTQNLKDMKSLISKIRDRERQI